jgi:hypothetical protein
LLGTHAIRIKSDGLDSTPLYDFIKHKEEFDILKAAEWVSVHQLVPHDILTLI